MGYDYVVCLEYNEYCDWCREYFPEAKPPGRIFLSKSLMGKLSERKLDETKVYFLPSYKYIPWLDELLIKLGERGWDGVPAEWPEKVEVKPKVKISNDIWQGDIPLNKYVSCGDPFCPYCREQNSPYMKPNKAPRRIDFSEYELARMKKSELSDMLGRYGFTRYDTIRDPTKFTTTIIGYYD